MSLSLPRFSWLWLGGKDKEQVSNGSFLSSVNSGLETRGESENKKLPSNRRMPSSSMGRKSKRKWKSREEKRSRMVDKEYDVVLVPSDGVCLSGSGSDDSDWSIGWLEPHGPGFESDDEFDASFAVLVPCYRRDIPRKDEDLSVGFVKGVESLPKDPSGIDEYIEWWLSSLRKY